MIETYFGLNDVNTNPWKINHMENKNTEVRISQNTLKEKKIIAFTIKQQRDFQTDYRHI